MAAASSQTDEIAKEAPMINESTKMYIEVNLLLVHAGIRPACYLSLQKKSEAVGQYMLDVVQAFGNVKHRYFAGKRRRPNYAVVGLPEIIVGRGYLFYEESAIDTSNLQTLVDNGENPFTNSMSPVMGALLGYPHIPDLNEPTKFFRHQILFHWRWGREECQKSIIYWYSVHDLSDEIVLGAAAHAMAIKKTIAAHEFSIKTRKPQVSVTYH